MEILFIQIIIIMIQSCYKFAHPADMTCTKLWYDLITIFQVIAT